jgi:cellulose synthase (UDP-forming)
VAINATWALFNLCVLCVAAGAARESTQRRRSVRVAVEVPADVILADGTMAQGVTCDLSRGGMRARTAEAGKARPGDVVEFILPLLDGAVTMRATVVSATGGELRARFGELGLREAEALTTLLYSRADAWLGWGEGQESRSPLRGAGRAARLTLGGVRQIFGGSRRKKNAESSLAAGVVPLLLVGLTLGGPVKSVSAAQASAVLTSSNVGGAAKSVAAQSAAAKSGAAQAPARDLATLPGAFAGSGEGKPVSIVFAAQPSLKAMQVAGIVASWLGVVSGDRPVHFVVSIGAIPAGNAIALVEAPSTMLTALGAMDAGPSIELVANPSDATSSVLLLTGSDDDELLTAAMALALHGDTWHGPQVHVGSFALPAARAPDDAPRWLSTDHVATFAQAQIEGSSELQGDGSRPLTATLRLPPDLDYEDGIGRQGGFQQNLALHLDYRYNAVPLGEASTLEVYVNGAYISSTPMPHTDKASEVLETVVPVPVADLRPGDNEFSFRFAFRAAQGGANPANLMGAVLKDSYLDISGIPHWTKLPELNSFARTGFPFTRRADLADTDVVLPAAPTPHELEAFLSLMARMGAQTGLPGVNVTVTDASAVDGDTGKDLLVLGTPEDQQGIAKLDAALPVGLSAGSLHVRGPEGIFGGAGRGLLERLRGWRQAGEPNDQRFGEMETTGELPDATIEEIEWPRGSAHTAVVIALRDDAAATSFTNALDSSAADEMGQSVSVLHGSSFSSYRLGSDAYWVGALSPWLRLEFLLADSPWLVALVVAIVCFLLAVLWQARLRRRARERLQAMA